ncbi:MAG: TetR family transcriptional regulator [Bacteriovoracaceae bacterium]
MTKQELLDTKDKILRVATQLFAQNGFEGTSVRELALQAEVNIAAINYHFQNKENLYREVLRFGVSEFDKTIQQAFLTKEWTTAQFAEALYLMLLQKGNLLINNFKVFLNDFPVPEELDNKNENVGPPGTEFLGSCLEKDLKRKLSDEDKMWGVRVIFTFIVHTALMASTQYGKHECTILKDHDCTIKSLKRLVKVVLKEL